jgi:hypothetical protein
MKNYWAFSILFGLTLFVIASLVFKLLGYNEIYLYITMLIVLATNIFLFPFKAHDIPLKSNEEIEDRIKVSEKEIFLSGVVFLTNQRILYYRFGSILMHNLKREDTKINYYKYQGFFSQKLKIIIEYPAGTFTCYASKKVGEKRVKLLGV